MIDLSNWSQQIADIAEEFMNASIVVQVGQEEYGPTLYEGKARVQHVRFPREVEDTVQWQGARSYRFQIPLTDDLPFIPKGALIRVYDGQRDPELEEMLFEVVASTNSSHAAVRTLETRTLNLVVGGSGGSS